MLEIWRNIKDYEGIYQVSNLGDVKSLNFRRSGKERFLKLSLSNKDYYFVSLYKNGVREAHTVHRLVVEAFILNSENKPQVNHKDGVRTHDEVYNLEWVTCSENNKHAYRVLGRQVFSPVGELSVHHRLIESEIKEIRSSVLSYRKLSKLYKVSIGHIYRIKHIKTWKHV